MKKLACSDIGLDCGYIIEGEGDEDIMENAKQHLSEVHAIEQDAITSEMKPKITQNIRN